jgi:choline dehydrogenase-like flavoprotein
VDVVVIGTGSGGGPVARQLTAAGLRVVLLERGGWGTPSRERKDDLVNHRTPAFDVSWGPDRRHPRVFVDTKGRASVVYARDGAYSTNGAVVGGGTFCYGGMAWRFMPQDFRMRSIYGVPAGSTLDDWPITYDDLEPFYDQAEYEVGVSGDTTGDPFKGPRSRPHPMPPLSTTREFEILHPAATRLGWHPFNLPLFINSVPYNNRSDCMRIRWCVGYACERGAKNGTHNTVIPAALATGLCELRTHCQAREILIGERGRATGVRYHDAEDRLQEQPASLVVVAAGAIESARLLLNSRSPLFPAGLGNRHDWVGRNLQGHTYSGATGLFDQITFDDVGPGPGIAVCDFNHGNAGLAGGGMLCNEFIRLPHQVALNTPPWVPKWGLEHKRWIRKYYRRNIGARGPTQEIPVFDARVEVDPVVKDHWGIPVARMSGDRHPHSIEIGRAMARKADVWLKEAGAAATWLGEPGTGLSAGQHQAGTCRMGSDPKTSVVDRTGRVHDVPNVFVADASVHVTNGGFNPALTIMALGFWTGHHIATMWRGGGLR